MIISDIKNGIKRYGRSVYITDGRMTTDVFTVMIQPLRYKNKMYMSGDFTEIGHYEEGYYLYIGPADRDISGLTRNARIHTADGKLYSIHRTEKLYIGEDVLYIWAIIRKA